MASDRFGQPFSFAMKHAFFLLIASIASVIAYLIPTRSWYHYATHFLLLSMALLAIILIPGVGLTVKGATRWLSLGIFNLQPSEITKFTMMLFLASYLVRRLEEVRQKFSGFVKPMAVVGLIAILLLMEPDYGTLLVLSCAVMGVLLLAGAPFTQYVVFGSALFLGLAILAVIEPYRIERIETIFNPWADRFGAGYQLTQALLAFGRGDYLEWDSVILSRSCFSPRGPHRFRLRDPRRRAWSYRCFDYGRIYDFYCVARFVDWPACRTWRQALRRLSGVWACTPYRASNTYNLAVNTGLAPTTGLTLPLLSYGGSSLVMTAVSLGVIARVSADNLPGAQL